MNDVKYVLEYLLFTKQLKATEDTLDIPLGIHRETSIRRMNR